MADYISAELAATCAALGYYDGHKYHLDKHCIGVIKDLIKYLKRDDDSHTVRCFLGQTKVLQTDLIKILVEYSDKLEMWDVLLRLMINLTSSALIVYNEQIPSEKTARTIYQRIVGYLQSYKVALTDDQIWSAVSNRLGQILKIDSSERGEEDELIIERILAFIRNVLQIPPDENEKRVDNDATVHDEVLFALHASGLVDLLLFIASNSSEQQYHLQMLEIMSLMLREQNASKLAAAGLQRSTTEKEKDEAKLLALRQKEVEVKMERVKKYSGSRHSRFGGTYVVQNMKAIGENQLICDKPYQKIESLKFGQHKKKLSTPRNKRPMQDPTGERTSNLSVRLFLKEFCVEFLNGAYNPVMRYARSCIIAEGNQAEANEACCYLWALRFFMEFNRHYKFEVKYVSETISTEIFHLVQRQMEQYYEMMVTDKKRIPIWSRRLHLGLKAYQELLHTLMAMDKSEDRGVRESSKVIKSNVFYVPEYRETILSQLVCFDEVKMSRQYLIDLVTTVHIFLKMLSNFCAKGKRSLIVQKAKKKPRGKKKQKPVPEERGPVASLEERWDGISVELSAVMKEAQIPEVVPFDATLEIPIDEQKGDAMKRIQKLLRTKHLDEAVGLLRAARDVWPEKDCFGRADMPPEEEFLALREIFFADLGALEDDPATQPHRHREDNHESSLNRPSEYKRTEENGKGKKEEEEEENEGEDDEELEEEEEDSDSPMFEETNFNLNEFIQRFVNVKIVKALTILLQCFDKNTPEVNHYVAKMFHRIAWDCKMPGMMFQASIFRAFQRVLESRNPEHKELQRFACFIIRRFGEVAGQNRKVYMELLFWKTSRDAAEVVDGYTGETGTTAKVSRAVWTEAEEDELRTLFMDHQTNKYTQDLVDWILEHLINQDRTRRGVIKKLKEMCLIVNSKGVRSEVQKRLPKEWSEEEVAQLTELWEQLKDDDDPVDMIFTGLRIKRAKPKIKEKLLELGLAKDRKELYKKRSRKSNQGKSSWETQSVSNSEEGEYSEEDTGKPLSHGKLAPGKLTTNSRKPRKGARKQPMVVYTDAQLSGLLKDVIDRHMRDSLEWIMESLQDALDDRDEESSEGIPLVPLTDYSSAAMDTPSFLKLLRGIGLTPPADEQESYWRIPANMLSSTIRKRCDLIQAALNGDFIVEDRQAISDGMKLNDRNESDSDESTDVLENVKKFFMPRESATAVSEEKSDPKANANPDAKPKRKMETLLPAGEGEADTRVAVAEDQVARKKVAGGRARIIVSSSDSEEELVSTRPADIQDEQKRSRSDSSDNEVTSHAKKRRIIDSDEEKET